MPGLSFVGTWLGAGPQSVAQLSDLDLCLTAGGPVVYATSRIDQSITSFDLAGGSATLRARQSLPAGLGQPGDLQLEVITLDGQMQAVSLAGGAAGLPSYQLDSAGTLSGRTDYLSATGLGSRVSALSAVNIGGQDYLYVAGSGSDASAGALHYYRLDSDGALRPGTAGDAGNTGGGAQTGLQAGIQTGAATGIRAMVTQEIGGQTFLFAVSATGHQIHSYQLTASGALTVTASIGAAQGLGIDTPTAVETLHAGGQDYLVVAAAGSSSLTVLRIGADGGLTPTDHVIDDLTTRFRSVTAIDTLGHNGRAYVVAGGGDDGVSIFEMLPGGRLLHLDTVPDGRTMALQNVSALRLVDAGGQIQVLAGSETEAGLTQLRIDPGSGQVLTAPAAGGALTGGAGNDLLSESAGDDRLEGGGGDDTLLGGTGSDQMFGGGGADLFVVLADGQTDTIHDFQPGVDRINLSFWPMLRSPAQLTFASTAWGGSISFFGQTLQIRTLDGSGLSPAQMQQALNGSFLHVGLGPPGPGQQLAGSRADDILSGGSGDDRITGGGGKDVIDGGGGNDSLSGGKGADQIAGGAGTDRIAGKSGRDQLSGDAGDDRIGGGTGNDRIDGGTGHDTATGGIGNDRLWGRAGDDSLSGGRGDDLLRGGGGRDSLAGQAGVDRLYGNAGDDLLRGGGGDDRLVGGGGRDRIEGGRGDDLLTGGRARDTFVFTAGHDRITDFTNAGTTRDRLHLDDTLWSGPLKKGQVVKTYASVQGDDMVFDFGGGNLLTIEDYTDLDGITSLLTLI